jgi:hypothetical protein
MVSFDYLVNLHHGVEKENGVYMKKSFLVILLIIISLILIGCRQRNDSGIYPDKTEDGYTWQDNKQYLTYHVWSNDGTDVDKEKYMDAHFTNVSYAPFSRMLEFNVVINDDDYRTSVYYIITRRRGSDRTDSQEQFKIVSANATIQRSMGYNVLNEVAIIKVNSADLNPVSVFEPMAVLWVDDEKASSRVYPEGGFFTTNYLDPVDLENKTPYVDFQYRFEDTRRLITSLRLEVYNEELDKVVATKEFIFTEDMYVDNIIHMEHIKIDGLAPDTDYIVYGYYSGTDGVFTYKNFKSFTRYVTSSGIISPGVLMNIHHDLWGTIINHQVGSKETTFHYYLDNSGLIKVRNKKVDVVISIYNYQGVKIAEYPISNGRSSIRIKNEHLSVNNELRFEVVQTDEILSTFTVYFSV